MLLSPSSFLFFLVQQCTKEGDDNCCHRLFVFFQAVTNQKRQRQLLPSPSCFFFGCNEPKNVTAVLLSSPSSKKNCCKAPKKATAVAIAFIFCFLVTAHQRRRWQQRYHHLLVFILLQWREEVTVATLCSSMVQFQQKKKMMKKKKTITSITFFDGFTAQNGGMCLVFVVLLQKR